MPQPQISGRNRHDQFIQRHLIHVLAVTEREIVFLINPCIRRHQQRKGTSFSTQQTECRLQQFFRQMPPPVRRVRRHTHNIRDAFFLTPQQNTVRIQVHHILQMPVVFRKTAYNQIMLQAILLKVPLIKRFIFLFKTIVPKRHNLRQLCFRHNSAIHKLPLHYKSEKHRTASGNRADIQPCSLS